MKIGLRGESKINFFLLQNGLIMINPFDCSVYKNYIYFPHNHCDPDF